MVQGKKSRSAERRLRWFEKGTRAIVRYYPNLSEYYVCPLCLRGFSRAALDADVLTIEHAPPRAVGGAPVALTCIECNNWAGQEVDDEMDANEIVLDFCHGTMRKPARARLEMGGQSLNVDIFAQGQSLQLKGPPVMNDPEQHKKWVSELDRLADEGGFQGYELKVSLVRSFSPQKARLGWLRSAYLAAFAAFGYRYILDPKLKIVRQQLADLTTNLIDVFSVTLKAADPKDRSIVIVNESEWANSLAMQMGRHVVLLPWLEDGPVIYERLQGKGGAPTDITYSGKTLPWPHNPTFLFDQEQ